MLPSPVERPQLELSGPKLGLALETLVGRADELGGIEAFVEALKAKSALFRLSLDKELTLKDFRTLCAHMATVRRRIGAYAQPDAFASVKKHVEELFSGGDSLDARIGRFCARFPDDREHRWVRDLAAELLHFADLEEAEMCIVRLDELLRKFQGLKEHAAAERVREVARLGRRRAEMIAHNQKVDAEKREEKGEIARWFAIWLETPDAFFDWLEVRKQSAEFRQKFRESGS